MDQTKNKLQDYPFDLYQRNRDIQEIVGIIARETGKERLKILDVGGFRIDAEDRDNLLLREFLPQHEIVSLDLVDSFIPGYVRGDGTQLPFKDKTFDVVVTSDVYEHVPAEERKKFLESLVRVATNFVILGAPFYSEKNALAENILFEYIRKVLHAEQEQLKEHIENRLPDAKEFKGFLEERGLDYTCFHSGHLHSWLLMMMVKHYMMTIPGSDRLHTMLDRFYNMSCYKSDHRETGYRKVFVVAKEKASGEILKKVEDHFAAYADEYKGSTLETSDLSHIQLLLSLEELRTRRLFEEKEMIIRQQKEKIEALERSRRTRICRFINAIYNFSFGFLIKGCFVSLRKTPQFFYILFRTRKNPFLVLSDSAYQRWVRKNALTGEKITAVRKTIAKLNYKPLISIVVPVYNIDGRMLEKAIESVLNQVYENWELCIVDDASPGRHIRRILKKYRRRDRRIKVKYLKKNQGISGASNETLTMAEGEYAALLDHDDELNPLSLYEVVMHLNESPRTDIIYTDEDKLSREGKRSKPVFKPHWSPKLFLTYNYLCHLVVCRRELILKVGGFRKGFEGSQDYDLLLRLTELTDNIFHIPKVLYHWRMIPGSAAMKVDAKKEAFEKSKQALRDAMARRGIHAKISDGKTIGTFKVKEIKNP